MAGSTEITGGWQNLPTSSFLRAAGSFTELEAAVVFLLSLMKVSWVTMKGVGETLLVLV